MKCITVWCCGPTEPKPCYTTRMHQAGHMYSDSHLNRSGLDECGGLDDTKKTFIGWGNRKYRSEGLKGRGVERS